VEVTIGGTFYLNTVFDNNKIGVEDLKAFDTQFATRTFDGQHAYDGPSGWSAFLGAIVEPIVAGNLRDIVAGVPCAELVSSCALVQNSNISVRDLRSKNNQSNIAAIQRRVEDGLTVDLQKTLGRTYFKNVRFSLKSVRLPARVQSAIDQAQAQFAEVSKSQARVQQARQDARANAIRQRGYNACHSCARIDQIKALPRGLTALGAGFAVGIR